MESRNTQRLKTQVIKTNTVVNIRKSRKLSIHQQWQKEYQICWATLDKIKNSKSMHGEKWKRGMSRHWEAKLRDLVDNEPPKDL